MSRLVLAAQALLGFSGRDLDGLAGPKTLAAFRKAPTPVRELIGSFVDLEALGGGGPGVKYERPSKRVDVRSGDANSVIRALKERGYSDGQIAAIVVSVDGESGFRPRPESGGYSWSYAKTNRMSNALRNHRDSLPGLSEAQLAVEWERRRREWSKEQLFNLYYDNHSLNEQPGDGWRYRGRGWIQNTGRKNYRDIGQMIGEDLENNPDLLNDPSVAFEAMLAHFARQGGVPADPVKASVIVLGRPKTDPEVQRRASRFASALRKVAAVIT